MDKIKPDSYPPGTYVVPENSVPNGTLERSPSNGWSVKVRTLSGATVEELWDCVLPIIRKKPKFVILHARTNATVRTNWEKFWINRSTEDFHQWEFTKGRNSNSTSTLIDNNKAVLMVKHLKNDLMNTTCSQKNWLFR